MPADFTHLHLHTLYSLLDGAIRLPDLMKSCAQAGMKSVAVTDHGNMFGVVNFHQEAKKAGIKPIIGFEAYVAGEKGMGDKTQRVGNHLVLLAMNDVGYRNLRYLSTKAFTDGFYYDPRVDKPILRAHNEGIIALTACMAGAVPKAIRRGDMDEARREARELKEIFGDRLYLEVQSNALKEQLPVNHGLCELSKDLQIPLVATADSHYVRREDAKAHEVLMAIASGRTFDDPRRLRHETEELYIKGPDEMFSAAEATTGVGAEWREAVNNSWLIAQRCNVDLNFTDKHLPKFQVPEGESLDSYVQKRAREGLDRRFAEIARTARRIDHDAYRERLERELGVIVKMGFAGYFLIVHDFIDWAKQRGVPVGPGRGSGAGSLVAYALRITDIDPIPYNLLFERFLNPERISMPDFDVDFCQDRRGEVIDYVTQKYGRDNVAQIITYGALSAKSAIKDVARVMGVPFAEVNELTRNIPNLIEGHPATIEKALEVEPKLTQIQEQKPVFKTIIDYARALEGLTRSTGMHAAGVVIGEKPLWEYVPLCRGQNGELVTQFAKDEVELAGLIKFDFLGLTTLTVISNAVKLINRGKKPEEQLDITLLPFDDKKTYQLISSGDTAGIFQMESSGFTEMVKKLKPNVFEDIIAAGALYRPGPLDSGMVDVFINRKHGRDRVTYPHPLLEPILRNTYGVIVYQEQVMQIAQVLGGYSLGRADLLRRAMGKKKADVMAQERDGFVEGCAKNGVDSRTANDIFDLMEKFAAYGFNKCLGGLTEIIDARSGDRTTIQELFNSPRPFSIHALGEDGKLRVRRVVDVVASGRKRVFEVRTTLGHRIVASANHPFKVQDGWKQLADLRPGDCIAAVRRLEVGACRTLPERQIIRSAALASTAKTFLRARPAAVAAGNTALALQPDTSEALKPNTPRGVFVSDGLVAKVTALDSRRPVDFAQWEVCWDQIASIEEQGIEETYDLTIEEDHNFVADGLIVHNSHSAAYGLITYQTAWLKTHHPVEFMAALLTSEKDNTDKVVAHIAEARADGITVLPPDVNDSELAFGVGPDPKKEGKKLIRFGLGAIKGVGENSIEGILAARTKPFGGLFDFCGRIDTKKINRKTLEALVAAGAFDFTGEPRKALWDAIEPALAQGSSAQRDRESGQFGLFGGPKRGAEPSAPEERVFGKEEWAERERLAKEKEALGFYITGHPLARYVEDVKRYATHTCASLATAKGFEKVAVAGIVTGYRERLTKTGKKIAFAVLEDLTGTRDLVLYEDVLQRFEELLKGDDPVLVRGLVRLAEKFGAEAQQDPSAEPTPEIKVDEVSRLAEVRAAKATRVELKMPAEVATPERLGELKSMLEKHPGNCSASLVLVQPGTAETRIALRSTRIAPDDDLFAAIDRLFGQKVCQLR